MSDSIHELAYLVHSVNGENELAIYDKLQLIMLELPHIDFFNMNYVTLASRLDELYLTANYVAEKNNFYQWLAGYIDGNGKVYAYFRSNNLIRLLLILSNYDRTFLEHLQSMLAGIGNIRTNKDGKFIYTVEKPQDLQKLIVKVLPHVLCSSDTLTAALNILDIIIIKGNNMNKAYVTSEERLTIINSMEIIKNKNVVIV